MAYQPNGMYAMPGEPNLLNLPMYTGNTPNPTATAGGVGIPAIGSSNSGTTTGTTGYAPQSLPSYAPGLQPGVNLPELTKSVNAMNVQGQTAANAARVPGSTAMETQSSGNISQELSGQVPVDVQNLLGEQAAERGISGSNVNADYLKALGLTSLQQEQTGQSNLSAADARNPGAPLFDPSTMLMTPTQAGGLNVQEQQIQEQYAKMMQEAQLASMGGGGGVGVGGGGSKGYGTPGTDFMNSDPFATSPATGGTGPFSTYNPSAAYINALYANIPTGNLFGDSGGSSNAATPASNYTGDIFGDSSGLV